MLICLINLGGHTGLTIGWETGSSGGLFFWSLSVMLTNVYVMKCKIDLEEGVDKKDLMSQYEFRKIVAIALINPEEFKRFVPSGKGGLPSDIANAVLYLSSDLGQYVNGETLLVDGGMIASQKFHD